MPYALRKSELFSLIYNDVYFCFQATWEDSGNYSLRVTNTVFQDYSLTFEIIVVETINDATSVSIAAVIIPVIIAVIIVIMIVVIVIFFKQKRNSGNSFVVLRLQNLH